MTPTFSAPNAFPQAVALLRAFLAERSADVGMKADERIQLGWWILRIVARDGGLMVQAPAVGTFPIAWADDCSEALNGLMIQKFVAESFSDELTACELRQTLIASRALAETPQQACFLDRQEPAAEAHSGWYLGAVDERRDVDDAANLVRWSLWEAAFRFPRILPFFLLPAGYQVVFDARTTVLKDFAPVAPRPGSYLAQRAP